MGYTSAEGLILTGQGSTNDVTIKNDADADVLTIPTGTTAAVFAGNLRMTKGGDIASASPLVIDTDGNYFDVTGTTNFAAMTVAAGNYFMLQFDGALTITHGSGIELPGAADLTTAAGDRLICYATAANTVEVMNVATEAAASAGGFTLMTEQSTTSGGTKSFTGFPSGTTMIVIQYEGMGWATTPSLDVQIGDSGGIETSGYIGTGFTFEGTGSPAYAQSTNKFIFNTFGEAALITGTMILTLKNSTNNTWIMTGTAKYSTDGMVISASQKALSGALTQVDVGGDESNAGSVNIMYQ